MNRYTFKIYPKGMGRQAYRVISICGNETLDTLCEVIMWAFDFYHEHLYEFCMDNKMYQEGNYMFDPKMYEDEGYNTTDVAIDELRLEEKQIFSMHYDFGDDWMFVINVRKKEPVSEYDDPELIGGKGEVEQYPIWED